VPLLQFVLSAFSRPRKWSDKELRGKKKTNGTKHPEIWLEKEDKENTNTLVSLFGFASHFEVKERQMVLHAVILSLSLSRSRDLFCWWNTALVDFLHIFHSFKKKVQMEGTAFGFRCAPCVFVERLCYFLLPAMPFIGFQMRRKLVELDNFFTKEKLLKESRVRAQYKFGFQTQRGNDWSIQAHGYQQVGVNQMGEMNFFCFKSSACCSCGQGKNGTVNSKKLRKRDKKKLVDKYVNCPSLFVSALWSIHYPFHPSIHCVSRSNWKQEPFCPCFRFLLHCQLYIPLSIVHVYIYYEHF
jgi:hypothetical protein